MSRFLRNIGLSLLCLLCLMVTNILWSDTNEITLPTGEKVKAVNVYYYQNSNSIYFVACAYGDAANITLPDGQNVKAKFVTFYEDGSILAFTLIDGDEIDIKFPNGDIVKTFEVRYKKDKTPVVAKEDDNLYSIYFFLCCLYRL